jgi:hypothetical protein
MAGQVRQETQHVGTVAVTCPDCGLPVPVPVSATVTTDDQHTEIVCTPDLADVWAHTFTHEQGTP